MSKQRIKLHGKLVVYRDGWHWRYAVKDDDDNVLFRGSFHQFDDSFGEEAVHRISNFIKRNLRVRRVVFCKNGTGPSARQAMINIAKERNKFYLCNCCEWNDEDGDYRKAKRERRKASAVSSSAQSADANQGASADGGKQNAEQN